LLWRFVAGVALPVNRRSAARTLRRVGRARRKFALFPHCCRIATFFVSSLDAALPLLILQHARKKIFVSKNTDKKNIVSDNCHKLSFYFLHI
jgi:hypothetical protein